MENRIMSRVNRVSTVNITSNKETSTTFPQKLSLVSTRMTSQNSLRVNIVRVVKASANMIGRDQDIIKVLAPNKQKESYSTLIGERKKERKDTILEGGKGLYLLGGNNRGKIFKLVKLFIVIGIEVVVNSVL